MTLLALSASAVDLPKKLRKSAVEVLIARRCLKLFVVDWYFSKLDLLMLIAVFSPYVALNN